jgi:hypothetical protein
MARDGRCAIVTELMAQGGYPRKIRGKKTCGLEVTTLARGFARRIRCSMWALEPYAVSPTGSYPGVVRFVGYWPLQALESVLLT